MKRYRFPAHRAAFSACAAVLTAITFVSFVAVPAEFNARGARNAALAAAPVVSPVEIVPARIDVIAVRERSAPVVDATASQRRAS